MEILITRDREPPPSLKISTSLSTYIPSHPIPFLPPPHIPHPARPTPCENPLPSLTNPSPNPPFFKALIPHHPSNPHIPSPSSTIPHLMPPFALNFALPIRIVLKCATSLMEWFMHDGETIACGKMAMGLWGDGAPSRTRRSRRGWLALGHLGEFESLTGSKARAAGNRRFLCFGKLDGSR